MKRVDTFKGMIYTMETKMKPYKTQLIDWKNRRLKMIALIGQGKKQSDVARIMGVSRQAICKAIKKERNG